MDLVAIARRAATQHPDRLALTFEDTSQSYGQLFERACRLDQALAGLGLQAGDRVATLTDNSRESLEQILGLGLGAFVRSALYSHNSPSSNAYLLGVVGARALLVQRQHYDAIAPHLDEVDDLQHVIVFDGEVPDGTLDYEALLADAPSHDRGIVADLDAPYLIRFSAGTTGKPKGILHTVGRWAALSSEMSLVLPTLGPDDRYLAAGPLSHATSMPLNSVLHGGGAIVLLAAFDPAEFLRRIEEDRCTISFGVPTMVQLAASHPDAATRDVSSLRALIYGGAPMTGAILELARKVFGDVMLQLYGQSEGAPLTWLSPDDHLAQDGRWLRSAGRETPSTTITILGEDGQELPRGEVGEIAARTPTAMAEVWGDPEATAARRTANGSILTRDMGYLDADGFLFITDRKEDMIISGGHNIWPAELENCLAGHPAVREVSVVGVPHETWGETPMAAVVVEDGAQVTEEELVAWTREELGGTKKVTSVVFVDELPKTPVGKVLRRVIRDTYGPEASGQA